jgi:aminoglycoside phosphotransferase (APT) family kinase protein
MSDLAIAMVYWTEHGDNLRRLIPVAEDVTTGPGFWSRKKFVEMYAARSGRSLERLDIWLAVASLKLAVIMESIRKRILDGAQIGTSADEAARMKEATEALTTMGLHVLDGRGLDALSS